MQTATGNRMAALTPSTNHGQIAEVPCAHLSQVEANLIHAGHMLTQSQSAEHQLIPVLEVMGRISGSASFSVQTRREFTFEY